MAADYHDFVDKKISHIRESTASADEPVFTDTKAARMFDFNPIGLEDLLTIIKETPSKQCSLNTLATRLLKDSDTISGFVHPSNRQQLLSVGLLSGWMEACHRVSNPQESRSR